MALRLCLVLVCLCANAAARAGAFMQAPEHGQVIAELGFAEAGRGYDASGRALPIPSWRKFELTTYAEYGLTDWLTLIGEPAWFTFHAQGPSQSRTRIGAAEAGARARILEWDGNVVSGQATLRYAAGGRASQAYVDMGERAQVDLRLLYGRMIEALGMPGYVDMQAAFRTRGPYGDQIRFDMTWALRPFARTTLLLQSFTAITPGRAGDKFALSQKVQVSALYDVTESVSLRIGGVIALRGVNCAAERGLVSGMWWRF